MEWRRRGGRGGLHGVEALVVIVWGDLGGYVLWLSVRGVDAGSDGNNAFSLRFVLSCCCCMSGDGEDGGMIRPSVI